MRKLLQGQEDDLLRFVEFLDKDLQELALAFGVELYLVRQVFELQSVSKKSNRHWKKAAVLQHKLDGQFYDIQAAIQELIENTVRASSIVENLNSRLRNYFFLRRTLGPNYLELLQFFINHHRYERSLRSERIGKSPKELLTGTPHPHWLELLGYELFKRSSAEGCQRGCKPKQAA